MKTIAQVWDEIEKLIALHENRGSYQGLVHGLRNHIFPMFEELDKADK